MLSAIVLLHVCLLWQIMFYTSILSEA